MNKIGEFPNPLYKCPICDHVMTFCKCGYFEPYLKRRKEMEIYYDKSKKEFVPSERTFRTHKLKTHSEYFLQILMLKKRFEVRKNDRDFQVGDELILQNYNPEKQEYAKGEIRVIVTSIVHGPQFGIEEGYCVMSILPLSMQ